MRLLFDSANDLIFGPQYSVVELPPGLIGRVAGRLQRILGIDLGLPRRLHRGQSLPALTQLPKCSEMFSGAQRRSEFPAR